LVEEVCISLHIFIHETSSSKKTSQHSPIQTHTCTDQSLRYDQLFISYNRTNGCIAHVPVDGKCIFFEVRLKSAMRKRVDQQRRY